MSFRKYWESSNIFHRCVLFAYETPPIIWNGCSKTRFFQGKKNIYIICGLILNKIVRIYIFLKYTVNVCNDSVVNVFLWGLTAPVVIKPCKVPLPKWPWSTKMACWIRVFFFFFYNSGLHSYNNIGETGANYISWNIAKMWYKNIITITQAIKYWN